MYPGWLICIIGLTCGRGIRLIDKNLTDFATIFQYGMVAIFLVVQRGGLENSFTRSRRVNRCDSFLDFPVSIHGSPQRLTIPRTSKCNFLIYSLGCEHRFLRGSLENTTDATETGGTKQRSHTSGQGRHKRTSDAKEKGGQRCGRESPMPQRTGCVKWVSLF